MRFLLALVVFLFSGAETFAGNAFPEEAKPIVATRTESSTGLKYYTAVGTNALTHKKSTNELQLLDMILRGEIPLNIDVTAWDAPTPRTVAQAIHSLKFNTGADNVLFRYRDVLLFPTAPQTVEDVLIRFAILLEQKDAEIAALDARVTALE